MPVIVKAHQALCLWHETTLALVRSQPQDLSSRQLAILMTVYLEPPPHTVRHLAAKLNVTKPAITRALDTMGKMNLLTRRRDPSDRRNVIIQRTVDGALYLQHLSDLIVESGQNIK